MATKKKIKTYGVRGLMEWVCNIPVGKSHMRIEFTGGVLTSYGNTPAKFVTKDLLQQTIIEHSDFYKKKRIVLLSVVETNEDEDRMPKAPAPPSPPTEPTSGNSEDEKDETADAGNADTVDDEGDDGIDDEGDDGIDDEGDDGNADGDENPKESDENPKDADEVNEGERTSDGKLIVKVSSLDDAKTYLNDKCGIAVRELRSRAKILDAAEANGVSFEGI